MGIGLVGLDSVSANLLRARPALHAYPVIGAGEVPLRIPMLLCAPVVPTKPVETETRVIEMDALRGDRTAVREREERIGPRSPSPSSSMYLGYDFEYQTDAGFRISEDVNGPFLPRPPPRERGLERRRAYRSGPYGSAALNALYEGRRV